MDTFTKMIIAFLLGMFFFVGAGMKVGIFREDNPADYTLTKIKECWNNKGDVYVYTGSRRIECKLEPERVEIYPNN